MPPGPRRVSTRWTGFRVVSVQTAGEITGLTLEQLLAVPGVEQLNRIRGGSQEKALRIPAEVLEAATQDREAVADALLHHRNRAGDADLRARIREIIDAGQLPESG